MGSEIRGIILDGKGKGKGKETRSTSRAVGKAIVSGKEDLGEANFRQTD